MGKAIQLGTKLELIRKSKGKVVSQLIDEFHLSYGTITSILRNKEQILKGVDDGGTNERNRLRGGKNGQVEEALLLWIREARSENVPLDGPIIKDKALEFANHFGQVNFKGSNGWLANFKKRHGLVFRAIRGESASVDRQSVNNWRQNVLLEVLTEFDPKDVFNIDETGLFWRALPDKTITFRGDSCKGGKKSKERITILLGGNMNGTEKIPLLVIGKSKKPRCFKQGLSIPVRYEANSRAWMTSEVFEKFLRDWDRKLGSRKILLLLDNCPAHPRIQLKSIKLQFFVPNATAVVQPSDKGIIQIFKVQYRKILLSRRILAIENKVEFKFNLLDALHVASRAWTKVKEDTIANCFRKAGIFIDDEDVTSMQGDEELDEICTMWNQLELNGEVDRDSCLVDFLDIDKDLITTGARTTSEIALLFAQPKEIDKESTDEEDSQFEPEVTRKEAYRAFTTLQHFLLNVVNDSATINACHKIEEFFQEQSIKQTKRVKISQFFS